MASARELALELLPHLKKKITAKEVRTYAFYAHAIGRDPAKESVVVGPAMHAIGAACVFAGVPVAPLWYVERQDKQIPLVFCEDALENARIAEHLPLLRQSARIHDYTSDEFDRIEHGLRNIISSEWSPHRMWHVAIVWEVPDVGMTYFERALAVYLQIVENARLKDRTTRKRMS